MTEIREKERDRDDSKKWKSNRPKTEEIIQKGKKYKEMKKKRKTKNRRKKKEIRKERRTK